MNIEKKPNRIVMLPTNGDGDVDYAYIEYDLQNIEAVEREGFELIEGWEFKPFILVPAQQSPAPCAMPDDVKAALADLDASFYRVLAKNRQELTGHIGGNVKPADLVKVIEWARRNAPDATPRITEQDVREIMYEELLYDARRGSRATFNEFVESEEFGSMLARLNKKAVPPQSPAAPSPRINEQDGREKVLLEAVFKIEKKYFRSIHDHGATENAQMVLAELRAMIGLPMILKRDLPEWDGVAYVMPHSSNLVANQPALLNKLNNNQTA